MRGKSFRKWAFIVMPARKPENRELEMLVYPCLRSLHENVSDDFNVISSWNYKIVFASQFSVLLVFFLSIFFFSSFVYPSENRFNMQCLLMFGSSSFSFLCIYIYCIHSVWLGYNFYFFDFFFRSISIIVWQTSDENTLYVCACVFRMTMNLPTTNWMQTFQSFLNVVFTQANIQFEIKTECLFVGSFFCCCCCCCLYSIYSIFSFVITVA